MKNTAAVFGFVFLASSAFADFSGTWQGQADIKSANYSAHCSSAIMIVEQTVTSIGIAKTHFECDGGMVLDQKPYTLAIQNGMDLVWNGQKIGMIMDDTIDATMTENTQQGPSSWTWHVGKVGNQMGYSEHVVGPDGSIHDITGTFNR